jgi:hypothetical protein
LGIGSARGFKDDEKAKRERWMWEWHG